MVNLDGKSLEATLSQLSTGEKQHLLTLVMMSLQESASETEKPIVPGTFDAELAHVAFNAASLPDEFARADIFVDHD